VGVRAHRRGRDALETAGETPALLESYLVAEAGSVLPWPRTLAAISR
jgi:hypothetical protein